MAHRAQRCTFGRAPKHPGVGYDEPAPRTASGTGCRAARALARLPERQRTPFLRYYADLDYAAIGEALGI